MIQIFFFSKDGFKPMKDPTLKQMAGSHGWSPEEDHKKVTWVYGVALPRSEFHPNEVAKRMKELGINVLPGMNHPDQPDLDPEIIEALAPFGVVKGDKAHTVVLKMAKVSGIEPHFF